MLIGTRLVAPDGFGQFTKNEAFHFLVNHAPTSRVLLIKFNWKGKGTAGTQLIALERSEFEEAAVRGYVLPTQQQPTLPPWLEALEGINLGLRDSLRLHVKKTHIERIEQRLLIISTAISNISTIFASKDIEATLNQYARNATPPQNETRFRLWVLTYLCFGRNFWSLLPAFHLAGHWDRKKFAHKKMGAPSLAHGTRYGYGMSEEMADRCDKAYVKYMDLGKSMQSIYEDAMRKEFGCIPSAQPSGMKVYSHPEGKPFPTLRQFRYQIGKSFGLGKIQKNRYGSTRHRSRLAPSLGSYSADVANLVEKIEADGYFTKESPKGYLEGSTLEPLCVVTSRDQLSGMLLGIGFSFGSEHGTAYRMMLFSMAVPKDFFCSLWGMSLEQGTWLCQGLPPHYKVDRGPGSSLNLVDKSAKPVIRNLVESWSGQSKATIESSHPRSVKLQGQPTYHASNYTPIDLCRREIIRLITKNQVADMSARIEIDRELAFVPPTPEAIWNHYDSRFRNSAIPMSIDDAVRAFLTPVTVKASKKGVFLDGRRYDSKELRASGLLDRLAQAGQQEVAIKGYILDLCIRHIWIEVDHQILQLDATLKIREDQELLYMSFMELGQWNEARAQVNSAFRVHKSAVTTEYIEQFESQTGMKWQEGKRRYGRAKKNESRRQEVQDVQQHTVKRKEL